MMRGGTTGEGRIMTMPVVSLRQLFEAGVHFGHNTRRWNPKMESYLFGVRNNVHIIDLEQTVPLMQRALQAMRDVAAQGGRVLFVGTKRQAQEKIAEAAKRCGQYYVDHRWLGGMMTNWKTISQSIKRLREINEKLESQSEKFTKKESLQMARDRDKLERALGGIKDMGGLPDILFVIDTIKENIAIAEAVKLGLPVIAIVDSNSDPTNITYPIPGNDDASRAIDLYCDFAAQAVLNGLEAELMTSGKDAGASVDGPATSTTKAMAATPEEAPIAASA
jgi:small subunit ribosomal protein S2